MKRPFEFQTIIFKEMIHQAALFLILRIFDFGPISNADVRPIWEGLLVLKIQDKGYFHQAE